MRKRDLLDFYVNIYVLKNPTTGRIFYVGATRQPLHLRLSNHCSGFSMVNKKRAEYIKWLLQKGVKPKIVLLKKVKYSFAAKEERRYFDLFLKKGIKLLQSTKRFNSYESVGNRIVDDWQANEYGKREDRKIKKMKALGVDFSQMTLDQFYKYRV